MSAQRHAAIAKAAAGPEAGELYSCNGFKGLECPSAPERTCTALCWNKLMAVNGSEQITVV